MLLDDDGTKQADRITQIFAHLGFEKFFPKSEDSAGVNKSAEGEEGVSRHHRQHLYTLCCRFSNNVLLIFCLYLDVNTKESFAREGQDGNNDGDDRQREGKKEESNWWTYFQVWSCSTPVFIHLLKMHMTETLIMQVLLYTSIRAL